MSHSDIVGKFVGLVAHTECILIGFEVRFRSFDIVYLAFFYHLGISLKTSPVRKAADKPTPMAIPSPRKSRSNDTTFLKEA